jgi:hypothetical protein
MAVALPDHLNVRAILYGGLVQIPPQTSDPDLIKSILQPNLTFFHESSTDCLSRFAADRKDS